MANPESLSRGIRTLDGTSLPVVYASGTRVNATATNSSTSEAALPTGSKVIELRATYPIWIRFGNTGVGAAAADANSLLFPAGEKCFPVPLDSAGAPFDYFRVLRADTTDAFVQIERVNTQ